MVNGASEGKQHANWPTADEVVYSCLHLSFVIINGIFLLVSGAAAASLTVFLWHN